MLTDRHRLKSQPEYRIGRIQLVYLCKSLGETPFLLCFRDTIMDDFTFVHALCICAQVPSLVNEHP